jgi:hypothetical protein
MFLFNVTFKIVSNVKQNKRLLIIFYDFFDNKVLKLLFQA